MNSNPSINITTIQRKYKKNACSSIHTDISSFIVSGVEDHEENI